MFAKLLQPGAKPRCFLFFQMATTQMFKGPEGGVAHLQLKCLVAMRLPIGPKVLEPLSVHRSKDIPGSSAEALPIVVVSPGLAGTLRIKAKQAFGRNEPLRDPRTFACPVLLKIGSPMPGFLLASL